MKKYVLMACCWLISPLLFAQTVIRGSVTDEKGEALAGANVYIENTYDGTSSDVNGRFEFKTSEKGLHNLRVEFIGFKPVVKAVMLEGYAVESRVIMEEAFNELEAVVITAGSFEAGDKKRAIELTPLDVATTAGAMGDIVGAINTLPGATRVGESGRLYVRGGSHEETKTFIDGLLVGTPYYSSAPNLATRGRYNPFLFSGTIFNIGGYSAEYGEALSSVLLLNTNNAKTQDELNLSFIAGLGADATGTKSWDNGSVTASGTYFNMRPYIALVNHNQQWIKPMEMVSQETSLKQKTGRSGMFKWYSNLNHNRFALYQNDLDNPGQRISYDQRNKNYFFNSSWTNSVNEKWMFYSGVSATFNRDEVELNDSRLTEDLTVMHVKAGWDYQLNEKINIRFGSDYFADRYVYGISPVSVGTTNRLTNNLIAGYAEANVYTSTKFVFRIGSRYEYSMLLKKSNIAPRFSTAYKIDDDSQFSFAYGWFYQLPFNKDLLQYKQADFERADHFLLNYQRTISQRMVRGEVYYKKYTQLIKYNEPVPFDRQNYSNKGYGYAYGFDFFFRDAKTIKNGHYWISYSFLQTERDYHNFPAKVIPDFASKHNFSIVYKHFSNKLRSMISADFSYSSPRYYNDPNSDNFNGARMKPYYGLNMSWAYLFKDQIIFYASVSNVLGRKNEFGYRFSSQPDEEGVYAREAIVPYAQRFYILGVFFTFSKDKTKNQLDKIN